jgi:SAM-dependent methyltransferase
MTIDLSRALDSRRRRQCLICGTAAEPAGTAVGRLSTRTFDLARCAQCGFAFVVDPSIDFERLYDERYYRGDGADPFVDYSGELVGDSVRRYEWRGVPRVVSSLLGHTPRRWLDYGCGYGGLVGWLRTHEAMIDVVGHDGDHPMEVCATRGVPTISFDHLVEQRAEYDAITAIEVVEHLVDPMPTFELFAQLLAPGGVLFLTTGNAARHRDDLPSWRYVIPEVHVSLYEPRTLRRIYEAVGLTPVSVGWLPGMADIIRFKVLKSLGRRRRSWYEKMAPWPLLARLADRREGVSEQPAARQPHGTY